MDPYEISKDLDYYKYVKKFIENWICNSTFRPKRAGRNLFYCTIMLGCTCLVPCYCSIKLECNNSMGVGS